MSTKHVIKEGDTIISLSEIHGQYAGTIWRHADNAKLRNTRVDMNILKPGDVVIIPEKEIKQETIQAEQRHKFKRKGIPAILLLQLFNNEKPRSLESYRLIVDGGRIIKGTTNGDGVLEEYISAQAQQAKLYMGVEDTPIKIGIGSLSPARELRGVQQRLLNLGFAQIGDITATAVAAFQRHVGFEPTGKLDESTLNKLDELHDHVKDIDKAPSQTVASND
jgi:N-acetylmuramoyl-L-alanine amidase